MTLPLPLRAWEEALAALQHPASWAPLVQRLDQLVGSVPMGRRAVGDELSGLDGLARRGTPERLLPSAWALAEVAPEEFLRRAAHDELLYLRLDRVQPRAGRRAVLIFDTGPAQLGSCRLAQLALWVVLNRRAKAAGLELVPALLADPERVLPSGLQESAVHAWLAARSLHDPTDDALRRVLQRCGPLGPGDVAWVVCPSLSAPRMPQVRITQPAASPDRLEVRVGANEITLPLPTAEVCARLLRQPFAPRAAPRPTTAVRPGRFLPHMVWSPGGHRLLVRTEGGAVAAISVPPKGRHAVRAPTWGTVPDGAQVVALGWGKQRVISLCAIDGAWVWSNLEGGRSQRIDAAPHPGLALGLLVPFTHAGGARGAWVEVDGRIYEGWAREALVDRGRGAVWVRDGAPLVAQVEVGLAGRSFVVRRQDSGQKELTELVRHAVGDESMGSQPLPVVGAPARDVILVRDERVWRPGAAEIGLPLGARVLGAWMDSGGARLVWVLWWADGEVVQTPLTRPEERRTVLTGVEVATMSRRTPMVAWLRGHELGVFDLLQRSVRLTLASP